MVTPTNYVMSRGPCHFEDFRNIFLLNIVEDQQKSYHLNAGSQALCHVVNPTVVIAIRS